MSIGAVESLLELVEVRLEAFAVCVVDQGCALAVPPLDGMVIHYVLRGEGAIECEAGAFPIRAGMVAIIPKACPKRICGPGPVTKTVEAQEGCTLVPGMMKFEVRSGTPGLVLGCAFVDATVGASTGLFDDLDRPLLDSGEEAGVGPMFEAALRELSRPGFGTKAIMGAMMKQILLLLLRGHMAGADRGAPLCLPLLHPRLGRALAAMIASPGQPHSLSSLASLAGMSRSRFTHHFAATYGRSAMDYLQHLRLAEAGRLLSRSEMPVKSVAASVGFASRSHFSRAFRTRFGVDPTTFRILSNEVLSTADTPNSARVPGEDGATERTVAVACSGSLG